MSMSGLNFTVRVSSKCLVITLQGALSLAGIATMRDTALDKLNQGAVKAVIMDLSGVALVDGVEFVALRKVLAMGSLMGAKQMMVGIPPGVASALVEMDIDFSGMTHAFTVDDALKIVNGG
ncbi:MAG: anti-anti-sigma regulatory factor [Phenylobacterium sp.]|jgi:anti-anti-sigma regulatory factor